MNEQEHRSPSIHMVYTQMRQKPFQTIQTPLTVTNKTALPLIMDRPDSPMWIQRWIRAGLSGATGPLQHESATSPWPFLRVIGAWFPMAGISVICFCYHSTQVCSDSCILVKAGHALEAELISSQCALWSEHLKPRLKSTGPSDSPLQRRLTFSRSRASHFRFYSIDRKLAPTHPHPAGLAHESCVQQQRMATSSKEPPPTPVKLRYRALAYVRRFGRHHQSSRPRATSRRSFTDTGGARPSSQLTNQRRFSDSGGPRPVVQLTSRRSFVDSNGARPLVRVGSRRSFADSGGVRPMVRSTSKRSFADSTESNSGIEVIVRRSNVSSNEVTSPRGDVKVNTRNRRTSRSRKGVRKNRGARGKRRHRFLASLHSHGGHRLGLFCGCCVEQDAINPAESSSFHWGVGFDDSYYQTSSHQRLSKGTRLRLELCGLHVTTRGKDPLGCSGDISSVGARAASFDSGFGFTCASPVACPPPLGLAPARQPPTTLQLRSRDGTGSGKFTLNSGIGGFSSTGFKRKVPSSASYPSYTPTTPPSPFMNDFLPAGTFNNTRARSRVSVGCNGWFLSDDDPSIAGWHRRRSSGEVNPPPINTHLPQVTEGSRESEAEFDKEVSPKRYKTSPRASGTTNGVSLSPSPSVMTSPKPPLVPRPKSSSPANSRSSRVSILLLSQDGSISSSNGGRSWLVDSGIALVPLPTSPPSTTSRLSYAKTPPPPFASPRISYSFGLSSQAFDPAFQWQGECGGDDYGPPTKRRRSTGSSSNSSGGFGFGNVPRASIDEVERSDIEENLSSRGSASFTARFSASLRLTRSHSPRTLRGALSPKTRRRKGRRSRSQSASRSRRMFRIGSKNSMSKSASPPLTPVGMASRPSIVFIDCLP